MKIPKPLSPIASLVLCAAAGCGGGASEAAAPAPAAPAAAELAKPADYQLVWADEFDKPGLPDAAKWAHDIGMNKKGWHNNEKQYYSGPRAENAEVRDGRLVITARKEELKSAADWGGQAYTSTRLITAGKQDWTYGFYEIRAKMPCGKGSWPAIWMLGSTGTWPAGGELDILEHMGKEPRKVFSTVHTTSGSAGNGKGGETYFDTACTAFHNYQMLWTAQEIRFAVDGKEHAVYKNAGTGPDQWPFDKPQFLILNLAIGGDLGGPVDDAIFPIKFEVEYVRVYQKK